MNNMKIGATATSFAAVKAAFENNYACMEITCEEVGGLWFSAENRYYDGAEPCASGTPTTFIVTQEEEKLPTWAIIVIIVVAVLALCLLVATIYCMMQKNKYQRMAQGGQNGKTGAAIGNSGV
jgi:hypothetical protein